MNYFQKLKQLNDYFKNNLTDIFKRYMKSRGIFKSTISEFEIGYNGGKQIINFPYDYTDNLITFPVYDMFGRIVAFRCRNLDLNKPPKYLGNSNYTNYYEAGKIIFNLHKVLKKYYNKKVFVVEGPFDLISLRQVGIPNVVALNTNSMSEIQAEILYRYFDKIIFVLDSDKSGDEMLWIKKKYIGNHKHLSKISLVKIKFNEFKDANEMLVKSKNLLNFIKTSKQSI